MPTRVYSRDRQSANSSCAVGGTQVAHDVYFLNNGGGSTCRLRLHGRSAPFRMRYWRASPEAKILDTTLRTMGSAASAGGRAGNGWATTTRPKRSRTTR